MGTLGLTGWRGDPVPHSRALSGRHAHRRSEAYSLDVPRGEQDLLSDLTQLTTCQQGQETR